MCDPLPFTMSILAAGNEIRLRIRISSTAYLSRSYTTIGSNDAVPVPARIEVSY